MTISSLKNSVESYIAAQFPAIQAAWENITFVPQSGVPYAEINWLFAKPDNTTINPPGGPKFHRENGYVQLTLCYPSGVGRKDIDTQTDAIRAAFSVGTGIAFDAGTFTVVQTPNIMPGQSGGDRWRVPIKIVFFANVFE